MADNHWRHTGHFVKVRGLDARAFMIFPTLLVIKSLFVLALGCIFILFFVIIQIKGFDFMSFKRKLRGMLTGDTKEVRRLR